MEWIKISAKTVEDALTEASIQLETSSDNMEYRVIEEGSKGFLGLGAKKAVIEVRKKKTDEDLIKEVFGADKPVQKEKGPEPEKKPEKKAEKKPEKKEAEKKPEKKEPEKKEPEKKEPEKKETKAEAPKNQETPVSEEKETENRLPRVPADPKEAQKRALTFLSGVLETMGLKTELKVSFEEDTLNIEVTGDEMGILIGKRGQTLDSLQYLTSLVVNKGNASYVRVKLDTEDYRNRRKETLENLAKNIAMKVKKTRRPVFLEPMNPYERRIIHSALQNDPYVTTHSEGEEPCRKVVVTLKKSTERRERRPYAPKKDAE